MGGKAVEGGREKDGEAEKRGGGEEDQVGPNLNELGRVLKVLPVSELIHLSRGTLMKWDLGGDEHLKV